MVSRSHPRDGSVLQPGHPSGPRDGRDDHASRRIRRGDPWSQSVRPAMRNPRCGRPRIGNEPGMARGRDRRSCPREIRAIPSTAILSPVSDSSVMRGLHLVRPPAVPLQNAAHGGHGHPLRQSPHRPVPGACRRRHGKVDRRLHPVLRNRLLPGRARGGPQKTVDALREKAVPPPAPHCRLRHPGPPNRLV